MRPGWQELEIRRSRARGYEDPTPAPPPACVASPEGPPHPISARFQHRPRADKSALGPACAVAQGRRRSLEAALSRHAQVWLGKGEQCRGEDA